MTVNKPSSLSGVIIVDKPEGITSFRVVSIIRRLTGVKKVGHCGTLDPFATGVLPVCVGNATRVIRYMEKYDKVYRCTARFGQFSETQDKDGTLFGGHKPTESEAQKMRATDFLELRRLFDGLVGKRSQIPPAYSAIKIAGRPAYDYARKGIEVELAPRNVEIFSCIIHSITVEEELEVDFSVHCSKGTYIRSLCHELGEKTGFGAYAKSLRRTKCGDFDLSKAHSLEELEEASKAGALFAMMLPDIECVKSLPVLTVTQDEASQIRLGKKLPLGFFYGRIAAENVDGDNSTTRYRAMLGDRLIAVVYPDNVEDNGVLRIERMLDIL
jgi:tRNA pseudouridine55 synthase